MSGDYETQESREMVVLAPESRGILEGLMVVRETLAPDLTAGELQLFALVAARSGLDPFARQIYAVKRQGRMTIQTGIDGYRSIAARTGEYDGQDEPTFGPNCGCDLLPKPHPESSTVRVYRKGMGRPVGATAFWHEYVPDPRAAMMWTKMPHVMIAKVAEALALRKAFPWDPNSRSGIGSDIYTTEEMAQAENVPAGPSLLERVEARASGESAGVSLRYFAEAVREMDPEEIVRIRTEMYPEAQGVSGLSGEERAALLARLLERPDGSDGSEEKAGEPPVEQAVATDPPGEIVEAEIVEEPRKIPEETTVVSEGSCGSIATDPLMTGALRTRPSGHRGPHRNDEGSWPA